MALNMIRVIQLGISVLLILLAACTEQTPIEAAPLGEKQTLETLASSYRLISNRYPVNPAQLTSKAKRDFLERVFNHAGYNYSNTLIALARIAPKEITQYHRDMKQLLFLPQTGLSTADNQNIFSESEQIAIIEIENKKF